MRPTLTRLSLMAVLLAGVAAAPLLAAAEPTKAAGKGKDDDVDLFTIKVPTSGWNPYRIAVTDPDSNDTQLGALVHDVTINNLRIATAFKVLPKKIYPSGWQTEGVTVNTPRWRAIGAQGLIKARIVVSGDSAQIDFALWEFSASNSPMLTKTYTFPKKNARYVVHNFCNLVMKYYTKVVGAFGTQIAFVATLGRKRKDVFTMDHDGYALRRVSKPKSINILPAWSPNGRNIIFTSYVRRNPDLYLVPTDLSRLPYRVSKRMGLNSGAVYSPDGTKAAMTLTKDGNAEIYLVNPRHSGPRGWTVIKRLTNHNEIDTSPTWSPDGKKIAFVSSRFGHPQLWVMNSDGTGKKRLTRRGYYNQTPRWCPLPGSNLIAFTSRKWGRFAIFTYNVKTQRYRRITWMKQGNSEEPTWAPNCQLIAFASSKGGIWVSNIDGTAHTQIYKDRALQPRWGPWSTMR